MEKYQLTPEAVSDLLEICDFINQDNPEAADRKTQFCELAIFLPVLR
jgi:plasmid stabilization system protein ParE